jgi:hypothetical protein
MIEGLGMPSLCEARCWIKGSRSGSSVATVGRKLVYRVGGTDAMYFSVAYRRVSLRVQTPPPRAVWAYLNPATLIGPLTSNFRIHSPVSIFIVLGIHYR